MRIIQTIILYFKTHFISFFSKVYYNNDKKEQKNIKNCLKRQKNCKKDCTKLIYTNCTNKCYNNIVKSNYIYKTQHLKAVKGGFAMNEGKYTYEDICNYIIKKSNDEKCFITNLQLQKILYYIQGYFLKKFDYPAFTSVIQHWQYGPVVPEAYYDYCIFGREDIKIDEPLEDDSQIIDRDERRLIDKVFDKCCELSIGSLIEKTHNEAPWKNTCKLREEITIESITDYFKVNNPLGIR